MLSCDRIESAEFIDVTTPPAKLVYYRPEGNGNEGLGISQILRLEPHYPMLFIVIPRAINDLKYCYRSFIILFNIIYLHTVKWFGFGWFRSVLWHINHCRSFNAKISLYIYIGYIWFGLVWFYGISIAVDYLMLNLI